ncbi:MAG: NAD(P)/FAD-dependent oxidoreductase [Acetobacteraceae bacterium]|nr:NAD(P)/FAD-dependent oxidoreductase [Acetobacteraceae bacterium]
MSNVSADRADRFLIVGAGPSGLGTARALAAAGVPFEVVERHGDVGGIWDMDAERTPMYETAHFISSKTQSGFVGFPMPAHYPDYPGWRQVREYLRAFAREFDLRRHVQFRTAAEWIAPAGDAWQVRLQGGEVRRYRGVVLAAGHQWDPLLPAYPGSFAGESYHSFCYRSPDELVGKRVLVVGGGNSACDIACDAAARAERAFISMRRGYYFLPKHLFGKPTDAFFRSGPHIPARIAQPLLAALLRLVVGDLTRYGLPRPDHEVLRATARRSPASSRGCCAPRASARTSSSTSSRAATNASSSSATSRPTAARTR